MEIAWIFVTAYVNVDQTVPVEVAHGGAQANLGGAVRYVITDVL